MSLTTLCKKVVGKIVIMIIFCVVLSFIQTALLPTFTNEIFLSQLENDNFAYVMTQTATHFNTWAATIQVIIVVLYLLSIIKNIYTFIKYEER